MNSRLLKTILIFCILLSLAGCSGAKTGMDEMATMNLETVLTEDGRLSLKIPADWDIVDDVLNEEAKISVSNKSDEMHVMVIDEDKGFFEDNIVLDDYYNIVVENIRKSFTNCEFGEPYKTTVNGENAILVEITGVVEDVEVVYWLLAIESEENFTQVIGWTIRSKYERNRGEIVGVMKSLRREASFEALINTEPKSNIQEMIETVKSEDDRLSLSVPSSWNKSDKELNENADIAVSLREEDKYVIVANHKKDLFHEDFTLIDYYNMIVFSVLQTMENYEYCEPIDTEVNGKKAILVGIKGSIDKVEIAYWVYAIESEKSFTHVSGWTLYNIVEENRDSIHEVMKSFIIHE